MPALRILRASYVARVGAANRHDRQDKESDVEERQRALLLTSLGVVLLSPDALVLRWISGDPMHVLAWRGLLMGLGMFVLLAMRYRRRLPKAIYRCGWTGVACAVCFCFSTLCFLYAMQLAGAASTLLVYSIAPLVAGVLAWVFLGERLRWYSIAAIAVSMIGIAVIVTDDAPGAHLGGILFALAGASLLATNFTLARSIPLIDTSPALMLGALFAAGLAYALGGPPQLQDAQLAALALLSILILPLAFTLIQLGPRSIGAAEVGLLLLLEVVLGPLWVWLFLDEAPSATVVMGGAIVLFALIAHGGFVWTLQGSPPTHPARSTV